MIHATIFNIFFQSKFLNANQIFRIQVNAYIYCLAWVQKFKVQFEFFAIELGHWVKPKSTT